MARPIGIKTAAAICGAKESDLLAQIKAGELPRYGAGMGKVKLSDAVDALKLGVCPTCEHTIQWTGDDKES